MRLRMDSKEKHPHKATEVDLKMCSSLELSDILKQHYGLSLEAHLQQNKQIITS